MSPWAWFCEGLLLGAVALIGLVVARMLASVYRQSRQTAQAIAPLLRLPAAPRPASLVALLSLLGLDKRTRLIDLDEPLAFCHGLTRPELVLSTALLRGLTLDEVEAVLRHEQAHCRRRDPLRLLLTRALAAGLPNARALQRLAAALPVALELQADRAVIKALGMEALGRALLKVGDAHIVLHGPDLAVGAFSAIDARLDQLLGKSAPAPVSNPLALFSTLVLPVAGPVLCLEFSLPWCIALVLPFAAATRLRPLRAS